MSQSFNVPLWKKAPFIRLLLPLIIGILLEWYLQIAIAIVLFSFISFSIAYILFFLFPLSIRFKLQGLQGVILHLLLITFGLLITWQNDVRHSNSWFGNYYKDNDYLVVRINEPLVPKAKSDKANGYVEAVIQNDSVIFCKGKILLYFSRDSNATPLKYGDRILLNKKIQEIKNSGNPGAFNYQRYAAFQSTFSNVYLKPTDWVKLQETNINLFKQFIFTARDKILSILQKNIPPSKDGLGLAEALLIGYTNDLDKDLVQAYSNTGVVHIIAISGMHLALIYGLLVLVFAKMPVIKKSKTLQVVLILACLWTFSLLTGAAASIVRSAVMFTFIAVGRNFSKSSSTYNTLAASAFVMLCYNPYFLWDVGFQLSYLAVIGIIVFQKPIYNWVYVKNRYLNMLWELVAISLAAQVLTFPICIYYFHQFPNFFLITNVVAVPLSTVILYAEIALVAFSWIPYVGSFMGKIVGWMVWAMNKYIVWVSHLSYALWDKIPATVVSTALLYTVVIGISWWLLNKDKNGFKLALFCLMCFVILTAYNDWQLKNQQKIIVYNVPQHQAIDFIQGNSYQFIGDSVLSAQGTLQTYNLKPSRLLFQLNERIDTGINFSDKLFYRAANKRVVIINKPIQFETPQQKINVDIIIISKSPRLHISQLASIFNCGTYIFDASNSMSKIGQWQKECSILNLNFYSILNNGAFVWNINK